jgi:hypothetical protein
VAEADNLEDVKGHRGQGAHNIFSALSREVLVSRTIAQKKS